MSECPDQWDYARVGQACNFTKACNYPEGTCSCESEGWCAGVPPPPEYKPPHVLSCTTTDPSRRRPDGCPILVPSGACDEDMKQCDYPPRCFGDHASATCTAKQWSVQHREDPPPP